MIPEVIAAIRDHRMLGPGDRVVVAVSGGADSVALLHVLHRLARGLQCRLVAAHLDHGLRGEESDRDAKFTASFAKKLGISCFTGRADVRRLAAETRSSIEMAAREARYRFLVETARRQRAGVIATAHTADDQAETFLIRLARGSGAAGLCGIPWVGHRNGIRLVRPLLGIARADIESYLRRQRIEWREDSTNADPVYLRNRVRHEVIPLIESRLNPSFRGAVCRAAELLRDENAWMDGEAAAHLTGCLAGGELDVRALGAEAPALRRRILRRWLADCGYPQDLFDYAAMRRSEALLKTARGSRRAALSRGWVLRREYGRLRLSCDRLDEPLDFDLRLAIPGSTVVAGAGLRITAEIGPGIVRSQRQRIGDLPAAASLSVRRWRRRAIRVRSRRPGDRMAPFGIRGSRKLQDIMVDAKVPASARGRIPVFECGGEIVWVPGYRIASGWEVSGGDDSALQITVEPA